jgi:hypothetical protein
VKVCLPRTLAMHTFRTQHYTVRLRQSKRLRYRLAWLLLGAIPVLLIVLAVAYLFAGRS